MPLHCVDALRRHRIRLATDCGTAGRRWVASHLVFTSGVGSPLDAHNVRRSFRAVVAAAGLVADEWTPREMRHSFVSLLADSGMPIEHISRLVGHSGTVVTETVYRQQLRPVMEEGATAMDRIFPSSRTRAQSLR